MNYHDLDDFTQGYIECALWASNDESNEQGGDPLDDNYDFQDIAPEAVKQIVEDCKDFQESNRALLDAADYSAREWSKDSQAGHDFWLTRNGHGAGFWDRGLGEIGDKLTAAAHVYGECNLYVGDDKLIYIY